MAIKLTPEEFASYDNSDRFCKLYNLPTTLNWINILGEEWYEMARKSQSENTAEYRYKKYLEWYNKRYSKLGRALE